MSENTCCCCSGENKKKVRIEYLYSDKDTCDRCADIETVLLDAINAVSITLKIAGYAIEYKSVQIKEKTLQDPIIRVNGVDIGESAEENCSSRVYKYKGDTYEIPPKAMLSEELMKIAFSTPTDENKR